MLPKNGFIIPISKYSYIFRNTNTSNPNYRYFRIKSRNTPEDRFLGFNFLAESDTPIYKDTTTKMLEYDNDTILQILEYKIDKRKKANQSLIDIMNNYHDNVSTTFKNVLNSVMSIQEIDKAQAFRFIMKFETLQEVKNQILITQVHKVNADIKVMGIDLPYEAFNGYPNDIRKILLIRYILRDIEKKRSSITIKLRQDILEQAIKFKIYKIKSEDDKKKANNDINKLLKLIYTLDKKIR